MDGMVYEAVSYAMRYWFIVVALGILITVIYISYKEYREKKYVKGAMSKFTGYLEIVGGPEEFIGDRFGIARENTIGSSAKADIMLPDDSVLKTHALLYMEGDDLIFSPTSRSNTMINGRKAVRTHKLKTGDTISIGDIDLAVFIKRTRLNHDH